jgi:hypothetical protein
MPRDAEVHIRTRAYAIWEAEGRPDGRDLDHWLKAEAETRPSARGAPAASRAKGAAKPAKVAAKPAGAPSGRAPKTAK